MFKFLKEKIKNVAKKFSKEVEEEIVEEEVVEEQPKVEKKAAQKKEQPKKETSKKEEKKAPEKKPESTPKKEKKSDTKKETKKQPEKKKEKPKQKKEAATEEPKVEEKVEEVKEEKEPEEPKKKSFLSKLFKKKEEPKVEETQEVVEEKKVEPEQPKQPKQAQEAPKEEEPKEEGGFFSKITKTLTQSKLSQDKFEELFFEFEVALLENNVAVQVIEKIKEDLQNALVDKSIKRSEIEATIMNTLKSSIEHIIDIQQPDLLGNIKQKSPYIIMFVGVNGSGKTTSMAKVAHYLKENKITSVMAACDTFRAAAIQQLEEHANKLDIKMIKHDYGADPAAVAYDAIEHAKAKRVDVVLIDTAGRLHSNTNLMDELKKVERVAKPDLTIFVGESITGNDCVEQAQQFGETVQIDGVILTKADVDEKGGAALSVSYVTKKPILFMGMGQEYKDLVPFTKSIIMDNIGFE